MDIDTNSSDTPLDENQAVDNQVTGVFDGFIGPGIHPIGGGVASGLAVAATGLWPLLYLSLSPVQDEAEALRQARSNSFHVNGRAVFLSLSFESTESGDSEEDDGSEFTSFPL